MFTSSEVLRTAWAGYNAQIDGAREAAAHLGRPFNDSFKPKLFASYVRSAIRHHKGRAAVEAMIATEAKQSPEVAAIRNEIRVMDYSDGPTNSERYNALQAQLFRLSAQQGAAQ